eukprot:gene8247-8436_t
MADQGAEDGSYDYVCIIKRKQPALTYAPALEVLLEDTRLTAVDQDMLLYTDGNDPGACSSSNSADSELHAVGRPSNTENLSSQSHHSSIFFARVPPTVPFESIKSLFEQFGKIKLLNLFKPWASAKTSKGCGTVEFEDRSSAVAAMEALHSKFHWTGGESTMVVEWMDPAGQHGKDKVTPAPGGGKAGTSMRLSTARPPAAAAAAKAAKGACERRGSGTLKVNNISSASSDQTSGTSSMPHFLGSGYTLVAIPNNLPAHPPAAGVRSLAAETTEDSAWLRHADLAAAEAAASCCLPRLDALIAAATGPGCLGRTAAGQLLGSGLCGGGGGAAASGRSVVVRPGNAGILRADLPDKEDITIVRGTGAPPHRHAASLYSSSAPTVPRLAPLSKSQWDVTPPPPECLSSLPLYAESVGLSWWDLSLPSSLAGSCLASSTNIAPAHQQAGLPNRSLPGVAAMFPAAPFDGCGGLSAELLAMQQLLDELNGQPMHSNPCAAIAPGPGAARPVSRLLHLSNVPDELLRSRLPQEACHDFRQAHHMQPFAGATMTAPEALLIANQAYGSVGMPAVDTAATQQQLQAFVAACEAGLHGGLESG